MMPETAARLTILAQLADPAPVYVGAARVIWTQGAGDALAAILAQVDISMLARCLVVDFGSAVVRLAVAGRRLRGVIAVDGLPQGLALPVGQVLDGDDTAGARLIGGALGQLAQTSRQITVQSLPAPAFGHPGQAGLGAAALAALWAEPAAPHQVTQSPMARFLAAIEGALHGAVVFSGQTITLRHGQTAAIEALWQDQFAAVRQRLAAGQNTANQPLLVCLDRPAGNDQATAIAIAGAEAAVLAYDGDQITKVLASWRAITG